jgi:hypothetical protein
MKATTTTPLTLSASTITGDEVVNLDGDSIGKITEVMLDINSGRIAYAVMSFGGVLGLGDKLFAIPWGQLTLDAKNKRFTLDVTEEHLKHAEGFDKNHWPNFADESYHASTYHYWGETPYWAH